MNETATTYDVSAIAEAREGYLQRLGRVLRRALFLDGGVALLLAVLAAVWSSAPGSGLQITLSTIDLSRGLTLLSILGAVALGLQVAVRTSARDSTAIGLVRAQFLGYVAEFVVAVSLALWLCMLMQRSGPGADLDLVTFIGVGAAAIFVSLVAADATATAEDLKVDVDKQTAEDLKRQRAQLETFGRRLRVFSSERVRLAEQLAEPLISVAGIAAIGVVSWVWGGGLLGSLMAIFASIVSVALWMIAGFVFSRAVKGQTWMAVGMGIFCILFGLMLALTPLANEGTSPREAYFLFGLIVLSILIPSALAASSMRQGGGMVCFWSKRVEKQLRSIEEGLMENSGEMIRQRRTSMRAVGALVVSPLFPLGLILGQAARADIGDNQKRGAGLITAAAWISWIAIAVALAATLAMLLFVGAGAI
ncbi:hypothetical protein ACSAGD_13420 [Paramicrobacterium sp. CJ85]|uniref:hypothetical protein n=1 Tax=Paramicrobacterium sp. CJ85 TaxID=3445355 RepID=UPI003F63F59A